MKWVSEGINVSYTYIFPALQGPAGQKRWKMLHYLVDGMLVFETDGTSYPPGQKKGLSFSYLSFVSF